MKTVLAATLLIFSSVLLGGEFYSTIGVGFRDTTMVIDGALKNPVGTFELGYAWADWKVNFMHISSFEQEDQGYGLNMISIHKDLFRVGN